MKKFLTLVLSLVLAVGVSACGKGDKGASVSSSGSSISPNGSSASTGDNSSVSSVITEAKKFYTLKEGYENGWLTQEQLLSIAYYSQRREYNEELMDENYTPIPRNPESLSEEISLEIKQLYLQEKLTVKPNMPLSLEDIKLYYSGTYNDCIVVGLDFSLPGWSKPGGGPLITIGDVIFYYQNTNMYEFIIYK